MRYYLNEKFILNEADAQTANWAATAKKTINNIITELNTVASNINVGDLNANTNLDTLKTTLKEFEQKLNSSTKTVGDWPNIIASVQSYLKTFTSFFTKETLDKNKDIQTAITKLENFLELAIDVNDKQAQQKSYAQLIQLFEPFKVAADKLLNTTNNNTTNENKAKSKESITKIVDTLNTSLDLFNKIPEKLINDLNNTSWVSWLLKVLESLNEKLEDIINDNLSEQDTINKIIKLNLIQTFTDINNWLTEKLGGKTDSTANNVDWEELYNKALEDKENGNTEEVWRQYLLVEWKGKLNNIKNITDILKSECESLGFTDKRNPFITFINKLIVKYPNLAINKTWYTVIHNSVRNNTIHRTDLRGKGKLGLGTLLFNEEFVNLTSAERIQRYLTSFNILQNRFLEDTDETTVSIAQIVFKNTDNQLTINDQQSNIGTIAKAIRGNSDGNVFGITTELALNTTSYINDAIAERFGAVDEETPKTMPTTTENWDDIINNYFKATDNTEKDLLILWLISTFATDRNAQTLLTTYNPDVTITKNNMSTIIRYKTALRSMPYEINSKNFVDLLAKIKPTTK